MMRGPDGGRCWTPWTGWPVIPARPSRSRTGRRTCGGCGSAGTGMMYEINGDVVSIWHIAGRKTAADLPLTPTPGISAAQRHPTRISPRLPGPLLRPR